MFKATIAGKRLEEVPGLAHAGIRATLSSLKGTSVETGLWQDPATGKEMLSIIVRKGGGHVTHVFSGPPDAAASSQAVALQEHIEAGAAHVPQPPIGRGKKGMVGGGRKAEN